MIKKLANGEPIKLDLKKSHFMNWGCCDCGLKHDIKFTMRGKVLTLRFWRDPDGTEWIRKKRKFRYKDSKK